MANYLQKMEKLLSFAATKRHGYSNRYGGACWAFARFGEENLYAGIYQKRHRHGQTEYVREGFYWPFNPRTPAQQANRAKVAAGWIAYGALSQEQKAAYTERARGRPLSGGNLFMSEYLKTH
jgi:hypothetical protein